MPRLTHLDHCSLPVGDIDDAVDFYGDVLGLTPIPRPDFGFPGAWFDAGGVAVHLTDVDRQKAGDSPLQLNPRHVAFRVDDIDAMLEHLAAHDIPVWELPNSPAARHQIFFNDPWDNMIEMIVY